MSIISDIHLLDESALFCTVYEASKGYCIYKRGAVNLRLGNGGDGIMRPRPLTSTLELIDLPSTSVSRPTSISTCRGSYRGASPSNSNTTVNFGYFCTSSLFAGFISWEIQIFITSPGKPRIVCVVRGNRVLVLNFSLLFQNSVYH